MKISCHKSFWGDSQLKKHFYQVIFPFLITQALLSITWSFITMVFTQNCNYNSYFTIIVFKTILLRSPTTNVLALCLILSATSYLFKGAMRCLQTKPNKYRCSSCQAAVTSELANRLFHVLGKDYFMLHKNGHYSSYTIVLY